MKIYSSISKQTCYPEVRCPITVPSPEAPPLSPPQPLVPWGQEGGELRLDECVIVCVCVPYGCTRSEQVH